MWTTGLLKHELTHLLVGAFLSFFFYRRCHSKKLILVILIATFLIDIDHLFDYLHFNGKLNFLEFFSGVDFFAGSNKVFVFMHSWELVGILWFLGWRQNSSLFLAMSLVISGHLLVDQFSYTSNPLAYFLIARIINNFSLPWFNGL